MLKFNKNYMLGHFSPTKFFLLHSCLSLTRGIDEVDIRCVAGRHKDALRMRAGVDVTIQRRKPGIAPREVDWLQAHEIIRARMDTIVSIVVAIASHDQRWKSSVGGRHTPLRQENARRMRGKWSRNVYRGALPAPFAGHIRKGGQGLATGGCMGGRSEMPLFVSVADIVQPAPRAGGNISSGVRLLG